ncbi:MAG: FAD-dependent oxidoreductase [Thermomicrobiales bacterium]|nr:FAD-dependent oxidoreductase [Thermomicrobiales bacterium]
MSVYLSTEAYNELPVIIIGAGPIGLAAAAHLAFRYEPFILFDQADTVGSSQCAWGHVKLFTPWQYNIDPVARKLLEITKWAPPSDDDYPTGSELRDRYLVPLANLPEIQPNIRLVHRVTGIARQSIGITEDRRSTAPFEVVCDVNGESQRFYGRAVIDASGTWGHPNSILANGLPLRDTAELATCIEYGIPDVLGVQHATYAGKRTLVVGSGHSAMNVVRDLVALAEAEPDTQVYWAIRRDEQSDACGDDSFLNERTLLRRDTRELVRSGKVQLLTGVRITDVALTDEGLRIESATGELPVVDRIVACTGFQPDLTIERELRTEIFSIFECVYNIAELIDPDRNACGTVPPHGVDRLRQPEPDFFILGSKSYGRCGTFLLYTGYEQVRSVVAELCDDESANEIVLQLPERGLCSACDAWLEEHGSGCACGESGEDCCDEAVDAREDAEVAHA